MTTKRMQKKTQKRNSPVPVPVESVIHTVRGRVMGDVHKIISYYQAVPLIGVK